MAVPYLAVPTSNGLIDIRTVAAMESFRRAFPSHGFRYEVCSLLCYSFNRLYADALNRRESHGFTHFVMLHSDVAPQDVDGVPWCVRMLEIMDEHGFDALSAAVMIKDDSGATSAANGSQRLTPLQIGSTASSQVFTDLRINTGCLVIDITKPWADKLYFRTHDGIVHEHGQYVAEVDSEDWQLSRMMKDLGVRFGTTVEVPTLHCCGKSIWSTTKRRSIPQVV